MEALASIAKEIVAAVIGRLADKADREAITALVSAELLKHLVPLRSVLMGVVLSQVADRADGMMARIEQREARGRERGNATARMLGGDGELARIEAALVELGKGLTVSPPSKARQDFAVKVDGRPWQYSAEGEPVRSLVELIEAALVEAQQAEQADR